MTSFIGDNLLPKAKGKEFGVAAGIGDLSWIYSKLCNIGEPLVFNIADGWPRRSLAFCKMLPNITFADYGNHNWNDLQTWAEIHPYKNYEDIKKRGYGVEYLENNMWLLSGKRLEDWLPDLPTTWHYDIITSEEDKERAKFLIEKHQLTNPCLGISAASYRGSEVWNTWGANEWSLFLEMVKKEVPEMKIVCLGGQWDDLTEVVADAGDFINLVGKTSIGVCVEILKHIDWYIGYQSGMSVIRSVLNKQVISLWPDIHFSHMWSPFPPEMIENGKYIGMLWRDQEALMSRFKRQMKGV